MRNALQNAGSQLVENVHPNPRIAFGGTAFSGANATVLTRIADGRFGTTYVMQAALPVGGVADSGYTPLNGLSPAQGTLTPSTLYTFSADIQTDFTGTIRTSRQGSGLTRVDTVIPVVAGVTQRISVPVVTGTAAQGFSFYILRGDASTTGNIYTSKIMMTPGTYTGKFSDGDMPRWKWRGTAGASASVGYPYTLESILGVPYLSGSGVIDLSRADKIGTTEDRSIVAVYDTLALNVANFPPYAALVNSADGNQAMRLYGHATVDGANRIFMRMQTSGSVVQDVTLNGYREVGRHLAILRSRAAMTNMQLAASRVSGFVGYATTTFAADRQHQANRLFSSTNLENSPVFTAAYRGEMTDAQLFAAFVWLANAYSTPVTV